MERIEKIKQRLERNKKWQTQTNNGYVPSVVGEYEHADVEWLIKRIEELKTTADLLIFQRDLKIKEQQKELRMQDGLIDEKSNLIEIMEKEIGELKEKNELLSEHCSKLEEPIIDRVLGNKGKYQTIYEVSYGIVNAELKAEMTFEEAVDLGKDYCELNGFKYIATEKVDD